jgi:hypothetical protein
MARRDGRQCPVVARVWRAIAVPRANGAVLADEVLELRRAVRRQTAPDAVRLFEAARESRNPHGGYRFLITMRK